MEPYLRTEGRGDTTKVEFPIHIELPSRDFFLKTPVARAIILDLGTDGPNGDPLSNGGEVGPKEGAEARFLRGISYNV